MEHKNCWDFWECPEETRKNCPAYKTDSGRDCYDLAREFCPRLKVDFEHCWECPWYKKVKEEDEKE